MEPKEENYTKVLNEKYQYEIGLEALIKSLGEFRRGSITNKKSHRQRLKQHLLKLSERWDQRFPDFPETRFYSSISNDLLRGLRDIHLRKIIIKFSKTQEQKVKHNTIVNPACFVGRHARYLASRLDHVRVIATDINPVFNRLYRRISKTPDNYEFQQDNIYEPNLKVIPTAVVFFGACGSVSDAVMDYAVTSKALYLVCRTCCHQNIGGNIQIHLRFSLLNWMWQGRRLMLSRIQRKNNGYYFSKNYSQDQYPRSQAGRDVSSSEEFSDICRNAAESYICRTIIDLDRYLYLVEKGYHVWFRGDLFVAERY